MPVDDLPSSAQAALKEQLDNQRIWCPSRHRWLKLETEQRCSEHAAVAEVSFADAEATIRRGRVNHNRRSRNDPEYVAWEPDPVPEPPPVEPDPIPDPDPIPEPQPGPPDVTPVVPEPGPIPEVR